jgi:glucose 1-dehydrogenase
MQRAVNAIRGLERERESTTMSRTQVLEVGAPMTAPQVLKGQRALVTGANSGIGEAVAKGLAAAGAKVGVNWVSGEDRAAQVVHDIEGTGGTALALRADVSKEDHVRAMFGQMVDAWGSVDILVANAGLQKDAPFHEMSLRDWQLVLDVNLTGQFLCAREAVREFLRRGPQPELSRAVGKIIHMSSVHDVIPWAGHANYAASKGAVNMLMKSLAQEVGPKGIRVNSIGPGAIKTPINREAWDTPEALASLLTLIPYERVGVPEDIANAAVWLASDAADYVHGIQLYVDGGMTLYKAFAAGG